jgi:hypothetical protein
MDLKFNTKTKARTRNLHHVVEHARKETNDIFIHVCRCLIKHFSLENNLFF